MTDILEQMLEEREERINWIYGNKWSAMGAGIGGVMLFGTMLGLATIGMNEPRISVKRLEQITYELETTRTIVQTKQETKENKEEQCLYATLTFHDNSHQTMHCEKAKAYTPGTTYVVEGSVERQKIIGPWEPIEAKH